jgi:hypothetical protein
MASLKHHLKGSSEGTLKRNFLYISIFYCFIFMYFFCILWFYQSKLRRLYTSGSIFQIPLAYNYSTYYIEEFPIYFLCFMVLFLMYFFYILWFYWNNYGGYTQVDSFFKYRQCLIIQTRIYAFGAPASYLHIQYTNHLLTRSVHQPPIYKALTNQRGGVSVYRLYSLLRYRSKLFIIQQEHTIPYIFRAPGYSSLILLN